MIQMSPLQWRTYCHHFMQTFGGLQCVILSSGCTHGRRLSKEVQDKKNLMELLQNHAKKVKEIKGPCYQKWQSNPFMTDFDMKCNSCIYSQLASKQMGTPYLLWLFRNFQRYPNITKFYWTHSNVWKRDFVKRVGDIRSKSRDNSCLPKQEIGDLLFHINFLTTRHCKFFIFRGWLEELAFFICNAYLYLFGFRRVNINEKSQLDFVPVLLLFTCLFDRFDELKKSKRTLNKYQNKIQMIDKRVHGHISDMVHHYKLLKKTRCRPLENVNIDFIESFISGHYQTSAKKLREYQSNRWSKQFAKQEYMASNCQNQRGLKGKNRKMFVKCKKCMIAVYYSFRNGLLLVFSCVFVKNSSNPLILN